MLALGVAVAAVGTYGMAPAAASGGGGPIAQSVLGSGSDTTQFMMQSLDGLYLFSPGCAQIPTPTGPTPWLDFSCQRTDPAGTVHTENYEHDQVHQAYFLGSSNGINQLCQQGLTGVAHIDYARSSRAPKTTDCTGLRFVAYARDGISWEASSATGSGVGAGQSNGTAPCSTSVKYCLTQSQLQGIYLTCTITNWNQVGGANVPINPYTPQPGSGTRSTWDTFLGGSSDTCINKRGSAYAASHIVPENSNTAIAHNGDYKNAIFPFSFGVWTTQVNGKNGAILGAVDGINPTTTTIQNGSFPFGRFLYNVYCAGTSGTGCKSHSAGSSAAAVRYVGEEGWICKPATAVSGSTTLTGHTTDPQTGNNYFTDIQNGIKHAGFVPLALGTIGGGDTHQDYCRLFTT